MGWLKAHEEHFSREKTLEAADLTNRPLKELGNPSLLFEPPKHRMTIARIRVAISEQFRTVEKLLEPKNMGLPDSAYMGQKLSEDPKYGKSY